MHTSGINRPPPRRRILWALAGVAGLLLACCLLVSLSTNVGLTGWAWWNGWQLRRAETRLVDLETELQRLRQILLENGLEIPLAPADAQLIATVEQQMHRLRGLEPQQPLTHTLLTRQQLYQQTIEDFEQDFTPQDARDYALTLAAFDLLDPQTDVYTLLLALYTEQIAGYYDPETEEIYLIADLGLLGQMERLTYAHEYVHAMQDQHFDLEALGFRDGAEQDFDSEYLIAVRALVEGDASLAEQQFLADYYTSEEVAVLLQEVAQIDTTVFDSVPDVLRDQLTFPYDYGQVFVQALYDEGGWAAVDAAYADPPQSTEHILHPDRYRAGDAPQLVALPPLTDTLGSGWRRVDEDITGEYLLRYHLAQEIPTGDAEAAADGWDGDRYAVHVRQADQALVLVLRIVWDGGADAEEFVDAYQAYAEAHFDASADRLEGALLCWDGAVEALCLSWGPVETTVIRAPDPPTVERLLELLASTP